jgi:hypothetical protein
MNPGSNSLTRILLILSIVLSGCASAPQHLTEESQNNIKTFAVVSLVPESVNFDKIGIVSFSNEYTEFDMGGKVAGNILAVSQERIARSHPGWAAKSVEYDRAALSADVRSAMGFRAGRAREAFADLARKNNLDAVFVITASADEENNLREGLNVLLLDNYIDRNRRLSIRANLSVVIVDGKGDVMAASRMPAGFDNDKTVDPENFDLRDRMKENHRPEILDKLGSEVIADLTKRLNLCFDSLGF